VCEALHDRFGLGSAAKALHPVLALVKRAEDRGCAVKAALCQFEKEFDICLGQFRHEPFIQDEHLESCILVQHFVLAAGKHRLLSVFFQEIREPDVSVLHPLCEECLGHGVAMPATVVDHIVPHRGDPKLFWDRSNWQALCKRCHDRKTGKYDLLPKYKY
jgi:5-methylcytosine-specific restriction endonuclease McrA